LERLFPSHDSILKSIEESKHVQKHNYEEAEKILSEIISPTHDYLLNIFKNENKNDQPIEENQVRLFQ
jgi:hypothetical protein